MKKWALTHRIVHKSIGSARAQFLGIVHVIIPIKYSWANYTNSLVNHGICNKNRFHYRKMFPLAGWYFLPPNPISSSTEAEVHSNAISYVIGIIKQILHGFYRGSRGSIFPSVLATGLLPLTLRVRGNRPVASTSGKIDRPTSPLTM